MTIKIKLSKLHFLQALWMQEELTVFKGDFTCSPLKERRRRLKVNQQERDSLLFVFTLSVHLKDDSVPFVHTLWICDLYGFELWVIFFCQTQ